MVLSEIQKEEKNYKLSLKEKNEKKALMWSEVKEPKNKIAMKAFQDINQIKQKRIEKEW